ncbi:MAG: isoleucine--tRNA ligase [Candidatus Nanoarchaeia archaeon]
MPYEYLKVEQEILKFWEKEQIYKKVKKRLAKAPKYAFLDGPPYTTGRIHIGNAWNYSLKDCYRRFLRMSGINVHDQPGFDTHGLPIENKVEKKLGLKGKQEIVEKIGVEKFINECRNFALEKVKPMIEDFKRLGVWMDWDNPYLTLTNDVIQGAWWSLAQIWKKGLLYRAKRVTPWCPHCSTALAKHELIYKSVQDKAIYVKFPLKGKNNEFLLVWTTTPWTIPFNLAVMANPSIEYSRIKVGDEVWLLAKDTVQKLLSVLGKDFVILENLKGAKLEGLPYEHPFAEIINFSKINSAWLHKVILSEKYVSSTEGTGFVHCAPGCGPEDFEVGQKYGLPAFNELDEQGVFSQSMGPFGGLRARVDDAQFIEALEKKGLLLHVENYTHDYPTCWRCSTDIIFRATEQWFIAVSKLKEQMLAANKVVRWTPDWAKDWFRSWLENIQDWNISRQRFWGMPLPIWICEKCGLELVIGSTREIKELKGKVPKDLHRPWIDRVKLKCPKCKGDAVRIPDVLDVWLDSGSVPWATTSNLDFVADLVLEGKDQIRGWFNSLMCLSMAARGISPYKAVYMHGFINDALGRKMSKSLGNVISPNEVLEKFGADTFRYYTIGGANPGLDLNYNFADIKTKFANIQILWNIHLYLLELLDLLNLTKKELDLAKNQLLDEDKYMLSRLNSTILKVTEYFKAHRFNEIPLAIEELFLELSRQYIKATRERASEPATVYTISEVLLGCLKLFAPIAPFITEACYQNLREKLKLKEPSIHLTSWPVADTSLINTKLEAEMAYVKDVLSNILALREKIKRSLRWPIKSITIVTENEELLHAVTKHKNLLMRLANILEILQDHKIEGIRHDVKADFSKIGPKFGKDAPEIVAALTRLSPESIIESLKKKGHLTLEINGKKFELEHEDFLIKEQLPENLVGGLFGNYSLYLDTRETKEMLQLGFVREFVRAVQALRKTAKLNKKDKIELKIFAPESTKAILEQRKAELIDKLGAKEILFTSKALVDRCKWQQKLDIRSFTASFGFD